MLCALRARSYYQIVCAYTVRPLVGKDWHNCSLALSVMKPCSHVTCKTCTDTLVRPAKQCVVCDKLLAEGDVLELKREGEPPRPTFTTHTSSECSPGTGYAGGGMAETRKQGVAFQG